MSYHEPFDGIVPRMGKQSGAIFVRNYKDGKPDGPWEWYHENGQLKQKGSYKDGKVTDGPFEVFHRNGELWQKGSYKDGLRDGLWEYHWDHILFTPSGLKSKGSFKDGQKEGPWEYYYRDGSSREYRPDWDD